MIDTACEHSDRSLFQAGSMCFAVDASRQARNDREVILRKFCRELSSYRPTGCGCLPRANDRHTSLVRELKVSVICDHWGRRIQLPQ